MAPTLKRGQHKCLADAQLASLDRVVESVERPVAHQLRHTHLNFGLGCCASLASARLRLVLRKLEGKEDFPARIVRVNRVGSVDEPESETFSPAVEGLDRQRCSYQIEPENAEARRCP